MNPIMQRLVEQVYSGADINLLSLTSSMIEALDEGFRIEQDCILFANTVYFGPGDLSTPKAKTEYEEFLNQVISSSSSDDENDRFGIIRQNIEFAQKLHDKLKQTYPDEFRVVVQANHPRFDMVIIEEPWECRVTFYKIRREIDEEFRSRWMELSKDEALYIIE